VRLRYSYADLSLARACPSWSQDSEARYGPRSSSFRNSATRSRPASGSPHEAPKRILRPPIQGTCHRLAPSENGADEGNQRSRRSCRMSRIPAINVALPILRQRFWRTECKAAVERRVDGCIEPGMRTHRGGHWSRLRLEHRFLGWVLARNCRPYWRLDWCPKRGSGRRRAPRPHNRLPRRPCCRLARDRGLARLPSPFPLDFFHRSFTP
jgi:hypothetical protein